ncbi:MAG: hypothetical protein ACRDPD_03285 [Streptosporangiaceae bacterium]
MVRNVTESMEMLERRIEQLRAGVRRSVLDGDRAGARTLRAELRGAERQWDEALETLEAQQPRGTGGAAAQASGPGAATGRGGGGAAAAGGGPLLPLREQVHQALTLITVPAAPKLVSAIHQAFFAGAIPGGRLTSLRRDEERSFRSAPFARPYYICAALTADLLAPARGLLAVSTWPLDQRVIGPLSPRVDYLTAAIRVAESLLRVPSPEPASQRLLWRFAANVPGAASGARAVDPETVARAARAELEIHAAADRAARSAAADRARRQLGDAEQMFGTRLQVTTRTDTGS